MAALFIGTHLPRQAVDGQFMLYDKPIHAAAYFGLALLTTVNLRLAGWRMSPLGVAAVLLMVLTLAAIDELSQPIFGRVCDLADWLADATGAVLGVAVDAWRARYLRQRRSAG
ncbi:VanZ family protein [Botrimarina sp.]|uniref:VanZ family protein n=1 Tax=Botrimarina sp. TaxID=2795802 RepID=UPI0032ED9490